ncbi:hypothetical protein SNEBB_009255 [Seison nebaliae]|nr:hypothetical protein SNEBB_009255 [Seison nebaliae]
MLDHKLKKTRVIKLEVKTDGRNVEDLCKAAIHTILFNRCRMKFHENEKTHQIEYENYSFSSTNISYLCIKSPKLIKEVNSFVDNFKRDLFNQSNDKNYIRLDFYLNDRSLFINQEISWETWYIHINLMSGKKEMGGMDENIRTFLLNIVRNLNEDFLLDNELNVNELFIQQYHRPEPTKYEDLELIYDMSYDEMNPYRFKLFSSFNQSNVAMTNIENFNQSITKQLHTTINKKLANLN